MNLFPEVEIYEKTVFEINENRRKCYIVVMLMLEYDYNKEFLFQDGEEDLELIFKLTEENFFNYEFEQLLEIFPNAEKLFDRSKFLVE